MAAYTRTTHTTLSTSISAGEVNSTAIGNYIDDVMEELAKQPTPPFITTSDVSVVSGTSEYSYPSDCIRILQIINNGVSIYEDDRTGYEAYSDDWEADTGTSTSYTTDPSLTTGPDKFRLYPEPNGAKTATVFHSYTRDHLAGTAGDNTDKLAEHHALYVSCEVLARYYASPREHQDLQLAQRYKQAAQLLKAMLRL